MLILGPAGLAYFVIWFSDETKIDLLQKIILTSVYSLFLFLCVFYFCMTAFSDPGILPAIYQNSEIPPNEKKEADNKNTYYVDYQNKNDLAYTFDYKGISDGVQKYYSRNKFMYLR